MYNKKFFISCFGGEDKNGDLLQNSGKKKLYDYQKFIIFGSSTSHTSYCGTFIHILPIKFTLLVKYMSHQKKLVSLLFFFRDNKLHTFCFSLIYPNYPKANSDEAKIIENIY